MIPNGVDNSNDELLELLFSKSSFSPMSDINTAIKPVEDNSLYIYAAITSTIGLLGLCVAAYLSRRKAKLSL